MSFEWSITSEIITMHMAKEQKLKSPTQLLLHLAYDLQISDPEKYESIRKNYSDLISKVLHEGIFKRKDFKYKPLLSIVTSGESGVK